MPSESALYQYCLTEGQMSFGTDSEKFIQRYLNSFLITFGILGNALNLTVLLNRSMRSRFGIGLGFPLALSDLRRLLQLHLILRANTFLALLAFSDIVFLLLILPNVLINYSFLTLNYYSRFVYLNAKPHLLSLNNWASAVAIWYALTILDCK
jgi:hypothetical protein